MPDLTEPTPPPETTVADFAAAEGLVRWQLDALCARASLALTDRRPVETLKKALDEAMHGRL